MPNAQGKTKCTSSLQRTLGFKYNILISNELNILDVESICVVNTEVSPVKGIVIQGKVVRQYSTVCIVDPQ